MAGILGPFPCLSWAPGQGAEAQPSHPWLSQVDQGSLSCILFNSSWDSSLGPEVPLPA